CSEAADLKANWSRPKIALAHGASRHLLPSCCSLTIAIIRKRTVKLHGRHCEISVHREGKHVWIAVGDYLGKEIRAQAESEGAAVKRRRETASTMVTTERAGQE